jgi:hypothetical protein
MIRYDTRYIIRFEIIELEHYQVKDVRWNAKLGGQDMELQLVGYLLMSLTRSWEILLL